MEGAEAVRLEGEPAAPDRGTSEHSTGRTLRSGPGTSDLDRAAIRRGMAVIWKTCRSAVENRNSRAGRLLFRGWYGSGCVR
jgi:hypothetical protein